MHHWASWDADSTAGLAVLRGLVEETDVDTIGVAWDEFVAAPMGRIASMAQRPARWAEGEQAAAWVRAAGLSWPTVVCAVEPEAFFAALMLVDRYVPQLTLTDTDGRVCAHHGGPFVGDRWDAFAREVVRAGR